MNSATPVLQIRDLSYTRGDNLLFSGVDLNLSPGHLVHITGPNGCGKTSLLRLICNLTWTEFGSIDWQGTPIRNSESFKQSLIYVGHLDGLKMELTVLENLNFYARCNPENIDRAVERLELSHLTHLKVGDLSAGQRRRTALARLTLGTHQLWVLDEPLTSLDDQGRDILECLLNEHLSNEGMAVVTSHQTFAQLSGSDCYRELPLQEFAPCS